MDNFVMNFINKYSKIIRKSKAENLLKLLSAIEYAEGILEITASKIFGSKFKWFIVFLTQLAKCIIRLQLLVIHKIGILPSPTFFAIQNFFGNSSTNVKQPDAQSLIEMHRHKNTSFKLKHSGRVIRSINNAPENLMERDWTIPPDVSSTTETTEEAENSEQHFDPTRECNRYVAECMHIMRPLLHLSSLMAFDSKSWLQFFIPLSIDVLSLLLMNGTKNLSVSQRKELKRRALLLLHYFIRSPCFDNFSSSIITVILSIIEQRLPGARFITKPINNYIPQWREIYSYCWSV